MLNNTNSIVKNLDKIVKKLEARKNELVTRLEGRKQLQIIDKAELMRADRISEKLNGLLE